ncbi:MAG: YdiU family protein [Sphingobacteriales bacterium]|nr:MAG: YdiU family protein [Sphingobacteriales bacterium]
MERLSEKRFKNEFIARFPGDDSGELNPRQTPGLLYAKAMPTPVSNPRLIGWSAELAAGLGLARPDEKDDLDILAGNSTSLSMYSYAACYGGHQFGHWAGQLGDGRAIVLGEMETASGKTVELQLKGAGPTAYSRRADGRAVLRSSVREYLMSEAMHYLGIPTTRALSLVATGDDVLRDMFYDGNAANEPGAIVCRVAPSFLRFGSYELPASRKELENLRNLVYWTIDRYYPHITGDDRIITWYREVVERTAALMVEWMRVGFVHGVMNTDNMSVLGFTIDYGPFSFLDDYDINFTPNTTDLPGRRYAFGKQPAIAQWNLSAFGGAIAPLLGDTKDIVAALEDFAPVYWRKYYEMMASKMGLDELQREDIALIDAFEKQLAAVKPDMTMFYQQLATFPEDGSADPAGWFEETYYTAPVGTDRETFDDILKQYAERVRRNKLPADERKDLMARTNPRFVLRNYLLHQAIEALQNGENTMFQELERAIKDPYSNNWDKFYGKRPDWAGQKAGCSMLSCSS